jgi:zinc transporter
MTTTDLAGATPTNGIVWAYRFRPDGKATAVPRGEVDAALADPRAGWVLVHLALTDIRCRKWIARHAPVSELARDVPAGPDTQLRLDSLGHEWLPHTMRAF